MIFVDARIDHGHADAFAGGHAMGAFGVYRRRAVGQHCVGIAMARLHAREHLIDLYRLNSGVSLELLDHLVQRSILRYVVNHALDAD